MLHWKRLCVLVIAGLCAENVLACGTTGHQFMRYWSGDMLVWKQQYLLEHSETVWINYKPLRDDPVIAKVLADALQSGVDRQLVSAVLKRYHCVAGAHHTAFYTELEKQLGVICSSELLASLRLVAASGGVNLRRLPGKQGDVVGTIVEGAVVSILADAGNGWVKVRTYAGVGYIYQALLSSYPVVARQ